MRNALASRHQVDLARADDLLRAQAVPVQHFTFDHPGKGLQPDMRVRSDLQAAIAALHRRAEMVEKAPGADLAQRALRHGAVHGQASDIGHAGGEALGRGGGSGHGFFLLVAWKKRMADMQSRAQALN